MDQEQSFDSFVYDLDRSSPSLEKMQASSVAIDEEIISSGLSSDDESIESDEDEDDNSDDYFIGRGGFDAVDRLYKIVDDIKKYNCSALSYKDEKICHLFMNITELLWVEREYEREAYLRLNECDLETLRTNYLMSSVKFEFDSAARFKLELNFFNALYDLNDFVSCFASKDTECANSLIVLIKNLIKAPNGVVFEIVRALEDIRNFNFRALSVDNKELKMLYHALKDFLELEGQGAFAQCKHFAKNMALMLCNTWNDSFHDKSSHANRSAFKVKLMSALESLIGIFEYPMFNNSESTASLLKMTKKAKQHVIRAYCSCGR